MRGQHTEKLSDLAASVVFSKNYPRLNRWLPRLIKNLWIRRKHKELVQALDSLELGDAEQSVPVNWKRIFVILLWSLLLIVVIILGYSMYKVPQLIVADQSLKLTDNEWLQRVNEVRATLVQAIGGLILLIGLFFSWRSIRATEKNLRISQDATAKNLEIAQEGLVTQRFSKAIELLGSDKIDVRLGGIYALERIARESAKDHWPIMEILTAFIRENAPWRKGEPEVHIRTDIQAVLTVIGRRLKEHEQIDERRRLSESRRLNLQGTNLSGADLFGADLAGANLSGANLAGSSMLNTNLKYSILDNCDLTDSTITESHFEDTRLSGATFKGAKLVGVKLDTNVVIEPGEKEPSDFEDTKLYWCSFRNKRFLKSNFRGALFYGGNLEGASLAGADFTGATFELINLSRVDLRDVQGLVLEQLAGKGVEYDIEKLPAHIQDSLAIKERAKPDTKDIKS